MLEPGPERWKHVLIEAPEDEGLTTYGSETTASQARQKTKQPEINRIDQRIKTSNLSPKKVRWHFGVAPDVGLHILLGSSVNALLSVKYHYAFETDGATFSSFGLNFGLAYALVTD